jgi:poly(3-hydroxybutyrate) depolymerase
MQSLMRKLAIVCMAMALASCHDDDDNSTGAVPLSTGLQTVMSAGLEREYFIRIPDSAGAAPASVGDGSLPLVIMYHGYSGSYEAWLNEDPEAETFYDLAEVIGDQAILIAPNGLQDSNGLRSWGASEDFDFFVDLLTELNRRGLEYNPNRIFVAGHSNGGGHVQELACRFGDIIRGVAAAAGSLVRTECVGSVAVMLMQGSDDALTSGLLAGNSRRFWALYNGWDLDASGAAAYGAGTECIDYAFPGQVNSDYPVLWCEHDEGLPDRLANHNWPSFGSTIAWELFTSLSEQEPTPDFPGQSACEGEFADCGGSERAAPPKDADLIFRVSAPEGINRPLNAAMTLRPVDFLENPTCSAPDVILNLSFPVDGVVVAGQVSREITIPITYFTFSGAVEYPSDWALAFTVYVEPDDPNQAPSGTIPSPGVDQDASILFTVRDPMDFPVVDISDTPLELRPARDLCNLTDDPND